MAVKCDKCGQKQPGPSRYQRTCNRHQTSEPTNYCQGTMRPENQFNASGVWVQPSQPYTDHISN